MTDTATIGAAKERRIGWRAIAVVVVLVAPACGGGTFPVDGPLIRYPSPPESLDAMTAEITGVLQLDQGCLYIRGDVERYPVLWPHGSRWDADARSVELAGEAVEVGDEVYGGGGYLDVGAVARLAGDEAAAVADRCVDNLYGEVIVVNNRDGAIGPADAAP